MAQGKQQLKIERNQHNGLEMIVTRTKDDTGRMKFDIMKSSRADKISMENMACWAEMMEELLSPYRFKCKPRTIYIKVGGPVSVQTCLVSAAYSFDGVYLTPGSADRTIQLQSQGIHLERRWL